MHTKYRRRQVAVRDLQNVYFQFSQVVGQYQQYQIQQRPNLCKKQLKYLYALNLEQFNANIQLAMQTAQKNYSQLSATALQQAGNIQYSYKGIKTLFLNKGGEALPRIVTENRMRLSTTQIVLQQLFFQTNYFKRRRQRTALFQIVLQKSFKFIKTQLEKQSARQQQNKYLHLVQLTHQILLYPSSHLLFKQTKESSRRALQRQIMQFSAILANPSLAELLSNKLPKTIAKLVYQAY